MTAYMSGQKGVKSHCSSNPEGLGAAHKCQHGGSGFNVAMRMSLYPAVHL